MPMYLCKSLKQRRKYTICNEVPWPNSIEKSSICLAIVGEYTRGIKLISNGFIYPNVVRSGASGKQFYIFVFLFADRKCCNILFFVLYKSFFVYYHIRDYAILYKFARRVWPCKNVAEAKSS